MRLHLKINDVEGQDERKRHILLVDDESLREALQEHEGWMMQEVVKTWLMRKPSLMSQILDDPDLRNTIYNQEKARREARSEQRQRHKQFEIDRIRRQERHQASIATRKALDFYHDVLGIEKEES